MIPEYPQFKFLELQDLDRIKTYLDHYNPDICELSPANLFIWSEFDHPQLTRINQNLCVYLSPVNEPPFFLEPIGSHKILETLCICLRHAQKTSRASEKLAGRIPKHIYKIHELRSHFDYVYETEALARLKGRKYDGKRNHIKKFKIRHPDGAFAPLSAEHKAGALALFDEWSAAKKHSRFFNKLAHAAQKNAVEKAFDHFKALGLTGGFLSIEGKIKGFTLASRLNAETLSVHFMYGHPAVQGIAQALLWEACNKVYAKYRYVNLEQDLGIPGLRKAKLDSHPYKLEKKYEISPIRA